MPHVLGITKSRPLYLKKKGEVIFKITQFTYPHLSLSLSSSSFVASATAAGDELIFGSYVLIVYHGAGISSSSPSASSSLIPFTRSHHRLFHLRLGLLLRPIQTSGMASFRQIAPPHPPSVVPPPAPHSNPQFQPYPSQHHGGSVPAYGRVRPVSASHTGFASSFAHPVVQQQYPYAPTFPQAPPPPSDSYAPSVYYPSSQHPPQYNQPSHPPPLPLPPPSSFPSNHSLPPPQPPPVPPPSVPPPLPLSNQTQPNLPPMNVHHQGTARVDPPGHQHKPSLPPKQQEPPSRPAAGRVPIHAGGPNGVSSRVETEEERRLRKKREYEKQKHEERRQLLLKNSQTTVLQKTQLLAGNARPSGSMAGSRVADQRTSSLLAKERIENRLKKPTTFICKMK